MPVRQHARAQPGQGGAQGFILDVGAAALGFRAGGGIIHGLAARGRAADADRSLPQQKPPDAAPAQMRVHALNHQRADMLQFKRKAAFDALYESEQRGRSLSQALADFNTRQAEKLQSLSEADYVRSIIAGLDTNGEAVDKTISAALREWTLVRLFPVDRAILRIAVWELSFSDTPADVVRSEALALAAQYSSDDAVSFIGGILGAVSRES